MGIAALLLVFCGCQEKTPSTPSTPTTTKAAVPSTRDDTRFIQIRNLLSKDPESQERAMKLYRLVEPVCKEEKERADFLEVAKWSSSFSIGRDTLPTVLALDTIEHVATSCARNYSAAAYDLLDRAKIAVPDPYRYALIKARLLAAEGKLADALAEAKSAAAGGSVHAIALTANIEAQLAREKAVGYQPGMLDGAIAMVSAEPTQSWSLIDLTAVLSTRAHLLTERGVWESGAASIETRKLAAESYRRLSVAPFIEATRMQALDMLCFDSVELGGGGDACARAGSELGILGAAVLSQIERDARRIDLGRLAKLEQLAKDIAELPAASTVVIVARGDESELISWARPASKVIGAIAKRGAKLVVLDRARTPRASALVKRMLELSGAKPAEVLRAESDTFAMPCLAAILAGRRTPATCPLEKGAQERIAKGPKPAFVVLVGRDLDAELDDLKLYGLRGVLLSFRQTRIENGVDTWLKSLSDVWIVAPREQAAAQ